MQLFFADIAVLFRIQSPYKVLIIWYKAAAVLHFCGLGYSRPEHPRGQTSDNFTDINNLIYEPHFLQYVKPAFSPVGLMLEFWEKSVQQGQKMIIPVHLINDTYDSAEDSVKLNLYIGKDLVLSQSVYYMVSGPGKEIIKIPVIIPDKKGFYRMEAELSHKGELVKSIREFEVR